MRNIQEIRSLKNRLDRTFNNLKNDEQYLSIGSSKCKLDRMEKRIQFLDDLIEDYALYDFLFNGASSEQIFNS